MDVEDQAQLPFIEWITRPQMLVALSAVLLSVCGLFISIYETWLIRQEQRAAVWPHVEVGASLRPDSIKLWVENVGIGPARIRAAVVTHEGEPMADWSELIRSVGTDADSLASHYYSFISGRVLAPDSPETIFGVGEGQGSAAPELMASLRRGILEGNVDVAVCYCSVYDQCWISNLQSLLERFRGTGGGDAAHRAVDGCERERVSRI